jgi:hypothetical protein
MASGWTNKGKYKVLGWALRNETPPTNLKMVLCTSAAAPTVDQDTFSGLTEITAGTGYTTGGYTLSLNSTDFDVWTQTNSTDIAFVQLKDITWTASGGSIPNSGNGARWAVLTDDNATLNSREVYAYFDLVSDRSVSDGQSLTLQDCELRLTE